MKIKMLLFPMVSSECVHLKKINFENISSIGYGAFLKCKSLKSVTLLENIKSIESHAFYGSGISELFIENANVLKEKSAFELCNELKSVVVNVCGKEIVKIPERTFAQCRALADVKFTGSTKLIVKIDRGAFVDAGIESIELPERLRIIGNGAFLGSMLQSYSYSAQCNLYRRQSVRKMQKSFRQCGNS